MQFTISHRLRFPKESFFTYFFGAREPGCFGAVDVRSGEATLFVPRLPAEYATWMGRLLSCGEFANAYGVEQVLYVDEVTICDDQSISVIYTFPHFRSSTHSSRRRGRRKCCCWYVLVDLFIRQII